VFELLTIIDAIALGIIQGITEWLPVSSSGHLAAAQELFGLKATLFFDVVLHLGTVAVVVLVFRKDIVGITRSVLRRDFKSMEGRLFLFILLGSVPTALIGFFFHDMFALFFMNTLVVGLALIANGFVLIFSERRKGRRDLGWKDSLLIGTAQGIAIIPGISRSGLTISAGLLQGVRKEAVARYSFLLMLPAVMGALIFEAGLLNWSEIDMGSMFAGFAASLAVGYLSLRFLLRIIMRSQFHRFAYYCWFAGLVLIAVSLF